jgi:hypothetical protein
MKLDWGLFFLTSVLFGAVASLMTCVRFYREYIHQTTRGKAFALALRGALCTFVFIVGFAVVSGYVKTIFAK